MKRKSTTFLLIVLMSMVGANAFAAFDTSTKVQVGNLYYYLDTSNHLAEVTSKPSGKYSGDIVIPASFSYNNISYSVTSIGSLAFSQCRGLTSVTIGNSVTTIGDWAFCDCNGLTSVTIPNSVTSIGEGAFSECFFLYDNFINNTDFVNSYNYDNWGATIVDEETEDGLLIKDNVVLRYRPWAISVTIPNSVTSIEHSAFWSSGLTSVTIPNSVTSIGEGAFRESSSLTSVISEIEIPFAFGFDAFSNIASTCTLTVPAGTRDAYIAAGWTESVFKGGIVEDTSEDTFVKIKMATSSGTNRNMIGYSNNKSLDFTNVSDVTAYIAVGFTDAKKVIMAHVNIVPANTGVVLKSQTEGVEVDVPITDRDVYYSNLLQPAVDNVTIQPTETIDGVNYTNLMVGKDNTTNKLGFITFNSAVTRSNNSYLRVPTTFYQNAMVAGARSSLDMVFIDSDEPTAIESLMQSDTMADGVCYDLQGRKVIPAQKGLYIRNGKKFYVK